MADETRSSDDLIFCHPLPVLQHLPPVPGVRLQGSHPVHGRGPGQQQGRASGPEQGGVPARGGPWPAVEARGVEVRVNPHNAEPAWGQTAVLLDCTLDALRTVPDIQRLMARKRLINANSVYCLLCTLNCFVQSRGFDHKVGDHTITQRPRARSMQTAASLVTLFLLTAGHNAESLYRWGCAAPRVMDC